MSYRLVILISTFQVTLILLMLVGMVVRRMAQLKLAQIADRQTGAASAAIRAYFNGQVSAEAMRRTLDRCNEEIVATVVKKLATECDAQDWETAVPSLRDLIWFRRMRRYARSLFWWRRLDAARAMTLLGTEDDIDLLVRLVVDKNSTVRVVAAGCLKRLSDPCLAQMVLDEALNAEPVMQGYVFSVLQGHTDVVSPLLVGHVRNPVSARTVCAAIRFMAEIRDPSLLGEILLQADHEDAAVRRAVARALGLFQDSQTSNTLVRLLKDDDALVRAQAADSLGKLTSLEACDALRMRLRDQDYSVRLKAGVALCRLGREGLQNLLEAARGGDQEDSDLARYVLRVENNERIERVRWRQEEHDDDL